MLAHGGMWLSVLVGGIPLSESILGSMDIKEGARAVLIDNGHFVLFLNELSI